MSEFHVEVIRIGTISKHTGADSLSITNVLGGYPCIIKTGDFKEGDLAVYVPIDALVPTNREEFKFLGSGNNGSHRVMARRLRGVFSMGILLPAPEGAKEGDDMQSFYGIEKYLPLSEREPSPTSQGQVKKHGHKERELHRVHLYVNVSCAIWLMLLAIFLLTGVMDAIACAATALVICVAKVLKLKLLVNRIHKKYATPALPYYDIEGFRKYQDIFKEGEDVVISEKLHGCQSKYYYDGKKFWISSRNTFRTDTNNVWATVATNYGLKDKLTAHPGKVLYGEVYGSVQDLRYGVPESEGVRFAAFDVYDTEKKAFLDIPDFFSFCREIGVPIVPTLYQGPWEQSLVGLCEGKTVMPGANHVREGIVIKPMHERTSYIGRVFLKLVGQGYMLRKTA